ncbi:hypothetical protein [Streptomyces sp. NPDC086787]|uniref:hypothetical protein n=1 Tax=Streptomyces sp. NPDC086787 TaxID=3365759 RepID=UPI0037FC0C67
MKLLKLGGAVCLTLILAACGTDSDTKASDTTSPPESSSPSRPAPPADKGPECDGAKNTNGVHVLRGGTTVLPGGGKAAYTEAGADGKHRTAMLTLDNTGQTVTAGRKVTVKGRSFTVAQICAYRVVLTTPDHSSTNEGADMDKWPTTQDGHWRLRWHVPDNGPAMGAVVTDIQSGPARASISVTASGKGQLAFYGDVRDGSTVEIAGQLWKVETINAGNTDSAVNSPDFKAGYVDLRRLGDA